MDFVKGKTKNSSARLPNYSLFGEVEGKLKASLSVNELGVSYLLIQFKGTLSRGFCCVLDKTATNI